MASLGRVPCGTGGRLCLSTRNAASSVMFSLGSGVGAAILELLLITLFDQM